MKRAFPKPHRRATQVSDALLSPYLLMVLGTLITPTFAKSPTIATTPQVLVSQIQIDVEGALGKNRLAKSYFEYGTSGYTSRDVFANVQAFRNPEAWGALCETLSALTPESLALFEAEILQPENEKQLPCRRALNDRLDAYWTISAKHLQEHLHQVLAMTGRNPGSLSPGKVPPLTKATVVERKIAPHTMTEVTSDDLKDHEIAIALSDGPHPGRTPRILDILKRTGVRAQFFHVGELIRRHHEIDHRITDENHTLGTHAQKHLYLSRMDLKKATQQIVDGRKEAEAATGIDTPFFLFPYGSSNEELRQIIRERRMTHFTAGLDSYDWKIRDASQLYDRILVEVEREKKGILHLHDNQEQTVLALEPVLEELKARGYHFVVFVPQN